MNFNIFGDPLNLECVYEVSGHIEEDFGQTVFPKKYENQTLRKFQSVTHICNFEVINKHGMKTLTVQIIN